MEPPLNFKFVPRTCIALPNLAYSSSGGKSAITAKLDPAGVPLWARVDFSASGNGIALNHLNEVVVVGYFSNVGTVGGVRFNLPGTDQGIFLEKLSNNGVPLWVKSWSATGNFYAQQVAVDVADNIILTGKFQGAATFGTNVLGTDTTAVFTTKCDRSGNVIWVRQIDNAGNTGYRGSVATDGANNVYVGLTPFDSVQTGTATLPGFGNNDALVLKYNPSGNLLWAVEAGGAGNDICRAVAVDLVGNVYMTGEYSGQAAFGTTNLTSRGNNDIYVTKLGTTALPTDTVAQQTPYTILQPQGARALVDSSVDFAVVTGGSPPLVFQWRLNGVDLVGETNASLIVNPVQFVDDHMKFAIVEIGTGFPGGFLVNARVGFF